MGFILDLSWEELESYIAAKGERLFRAKQIWEWIFERCEFSFTRMTNLPTLLRSRLAQDFSEKRWPALMDVRRSKDGTEKYLWRLHDGELLESVMLHYQTSQTSWVSACVSTQAGCPVRCRFCATGQNGFQRNLSAGEELAQVLLMEAHSGERASRILFMGMGEPFLNWPETRKALIVLQHRQGRALSRRKITVSTVGPEGMDQCFSALPPIELAYSLHAPNDALRNELIARSTKLLPLGQALSLLSGYAISSGNRVTLEYLLLEGVNDSPEQAIDLVPLLEGRPFRLNILPFNRIPGSDYHPSSPQRTRDFLNALRRSAISVTFRKPQGVDIAAACGQLRGSSCQKPQKKYNKSRQWGAL